MKPTFAAASILFLLALSCTSSGDKPLSSQTDTLQEANIQIARKIFESFNTHNWQQMAALYSNPAEFKDPEFGQNPVNKTHQEIMEKYTQMQKFSPDIHDEIQALYPSGNKHVIIEFISSGTAPDSTRWTLPICTILTIEKGVITKDYTYYDQPSPQP